MKLSLPRPRLALFVLAALLSPAKGANAAPPDPQRKAACAAAFEKGQEMQNESKLVEAHEQFLACSAEDCPDVVRRECNAAVPTIEASLPSIVLGARDNKGNDIIDAEVRIDGALVAKRLEGKPLTVNPGPHTVLFSMPNAKPVERTVVVRIGEKNRVVTVDLQANAASPAEADPEAKKGDGQAGAAPSSGGGSRVGAYVLGGLGVASLGTFAILGITGKGDLGELQDGCGKTQTCAEADVDAVKTKLIAADVALGVGIVSLGVSAALFFTSGSAKASPAKTGFLLPILTPTQGGGAAMLVGSF